MKTDPRVAVIMRSKNEMPHLPRALESLQRQSLKDIDLWAIDSGSTDGSIEVLQRAIEPDHFIRIAPEEYIPGKVLNEMTARTSAPFIVFQNADAVLCSDDALERLLQPLFDEEADAVMSAQITRPDARFIVSYDYQRAFDPKNIKDENADFFSAVTCAFRRTLWESIRFPEEGYAEDVAWAKACREKGARFRLVTSSVVEHSHNYTLKALYRKKFRHGQRFAELYGWRARPLSQCTAFIREVGRDLLWTLRKGRVDTIPYNIAYRAVIHAALYNGMKANPASGE